MADQKRISFEDAASYEQSMGVWSRLAGEVFLDWLAAPPGLHWLDVGCGSGVFSELLLERAAPAGVQGIDPSEGQLAFARKRLPSPLATFRAGDAMALPFANAQFDAAIMALVIAFVPVPAKGVAEMVRVVGPGGLVATYIWDMLGHGFPLEPVLEELRAMDIPVNRPPQMAASRAGALQDLWHGAGLQRIETCEIAITRRFASFEEFWSINTRSVTLAPVIAAMAPAKVDILKERLRRRLPAAPDGALAYSACANAIKGHVAG